MAQVRYSLLCSVYRRVLAVSSAFERSAAGRAGRGYGQGALRPRWRGHHGGAVSLSPFSAPQVSSSAHRRARDERSRDRTYLRLARAADNVSAHHSSPFAAAADRPRVFVVGKGKDKGKDKRSRSFKGRAGKMGKKGAGRDGSRDRGSSTSGGVWVCGDKRCGFADNYAVRKSCLRCGLGKGKSDAPQSGTDGNRPSPSSARGSSQDRRASGNRQQGGKPPASELAKAKALLDRATREEWNSEELEVLKKRHERLAAEQAARTDPADRIKDARDAVNRCRASIDEVGVQIVEAEKELAKLQSRRDSLKTDLRDAQALYEAAKAQLQSEETEALRRKNDEVGTDVGNLKKLLSTLLDNTQRGHLQDSRVSIQEAVQLIEKIESASAPDKQDDDPDATMHDAKPEGTVAPSSPSQAAPPVVGGSTASG